MAAGKQTAAASGFMDLDFYQGGGSFFIPNGDYACFFKVLNFTPEKKDKTPGQMRLGVMLTAHSLTDPEKTGEHAYSRFYGMGKDAHKSWAPNPDSEMGIVPLANGEGKPLPRLTNWNVFLESLYNSMVPRNFPDLQPINGVWLHLENQPEPEERKQFMQKAVTGDAGDEQPRRENQTIAVATAILPGGEPWEGGGGLPGEKPTAKGKTTVAAAKPPAAKVAPKPQPEADGLDAADVEAAAQNAAINVLEKYPNGCTKLVLKTNVFPALKKSSGEEMASAVVAQFFGDDDALAAMLAGVRIVLENGKVRKMADDE